MSNRKLTILGVVAVLKIIWAAVQSRISNRPKTEAAGPRYLIQGLDPAGIGSIVLGSAENTVTLKRTGGHFVVSEKDNYPADASQINELITAYRRYCRKVQGAGPRYLCQVGIKQQGLWNRTISLD